MDDFTEQALALVKAQAGVRPMSVEEMMAMVKNLRDGLMGVTASDACVEEEAETESVWHCDPRKAIKEKSVTCLECGKTFKIITKKHLASHDLDLAAYCEKWGFKKGTPMVCKSLQRTRRKKMSEMKLWEKRRLAVK